ncbi:MAG TPA: MinD/ParA family protein [Candidatus Polarisedimenticolia bacterium]|nr:MinD/ParA family protein [Candidatus Polarisedimenticolia bacterium]
MKPIATPLTLAADALAVTGSKGGVGKSNLAINLAIALARWGRRVLLVDGDLGLASLDILLGLVPERTVEHLVRGEATIDELLVEGPAGVRVLPAASGLPDLARLDEPARRRLLEALARQRPRADHVLVDTGAGLNEASLSLQLAAARVIVVTTPEPPSLVDAYATLKVLWSADPGKEADLVVNSVSDESEALEAYRQIARAAGHFLGREPGYLGAVRSDPHVREAVRRQRAVADLFPDSRAARSYEEIALRVAARQSGTAPGDGYWRRLLGSSFSEVPQ